MDGSNLFDSQPHKNSPESDGTFLALTSMAGDKLRTT
jgi:hypothetical protein